MPEPPRSHDQWRQCIGGCGRVLPPGQKCLGCAGRAAQESKRIEKSAEGRASSTSDLPAARDVA
jgi:hypothetical protein